MIETCIRPMQLPDASNCAEVHTHSFRGFFLTFLGPRFLTELYAAILTDPSGMAFVAEKRDAIVGFVAGTTCSSGLYTRLLHRRLFNFGWASLGAFIKKPDILPRLLRAFTMPSQKDPLPDCGTLMSIAVLPDDQGSGVGQRLVDAFLEEASRRGLQNVNLTTDCLNNEGANRFYMRLGFNLSRTYTTPEGRRMNEYIISLPARATANANASSRVSSPSLQLAENYQR